MSLMKNLSSGQRRHKENGAERRQKRREHRLLEESTLIELVAIKFVDKDDNHRQDTLKGTRGSARFVHGPVV
ncbi:hypothetical protein KOW79_020736 [Hemibagrus wyckioides]|uniref:Uncharacterized protein n=1 Tax=Hemibagrus wyckioides TaxID=337641 RepID=A0A9D3N7E5_9TELE|nr:hypothetical protein KOW79_020736 [Hemibagrus wyckioides]